MNDDEKFFNQFQEAPRPEFAAALYKRINRPMNNQTKSISLGRMALSAAAVGILLVAALLIYPPTRVEAFNLLRQIGVFTITTEAPITVQPTARPPDAAQAPAAAQSAAEASQLAGFSVLAPQGLPDGYAFVEPLSIVPVGSGKTVVSTYLNPTQEAFILINQSQFQGGDSYSDYVSGQETVQDVEVRGHPGVWITGRMMTSPVAGQPNGEKLRASNWLRWEENGIVYLVASDRLSLEEVLQLAQSLK